MAGLKPFLTCCSCKEKIPREQIIYYGSKENLMKYCPECHKEKINRELQDFINHYAQATVLLEQYATKTNVPSYLWAVIGIVVLFIILLGYRKFEHQIYRQSPIYSVSKDLFFLYIFHFHNYYI